ncbi:MAG: hypothetical protein ACREJC_09540 [Tepidisphaeraceae bacterium]
MASYLRTRVLLAAGAGASFACFWLGGGWLDIPQNRGYSISLLQQPSPVLALLVTAIVFIACTALSSLIAGSVRFEAGLFCAAVGLSALSLRGGPLRYVLFDADKPVVFWRLAIELTLLFTILGLAWVVLERLADADWLSRGDDLVEEDEPIDQKILGTATQICAMATLMLILCRSDAKNQALASVFVSSWLATLLAGTAAPTRPSTWYWIGPMFVGLIGYVWCAMRPDGWMIGQTQSYLGALARPLPLDYASLGTSGSILGYWMSRKWVQSRRETEPENAAPGSA